MLCSEYSLEMSGKDNEGLFLQNSFNVTELLIIYWARTYCKQGILVSGPFLLRMLFCVFLQPYPLGNLIYQAFILHLTANCHSVQGVTISSLVMTKFPMDQMMIETYLLIWICAIGSDVGGLHLT